MNKIKGIYGIRISNKWYIGASKDVSKRIKTHYNSLVKGTHYNIELQTAYDESHEFKAEIINKTIREDSLGKYEIYYIGLYDSFENGYNRALVARSRAKKVSEGYDRMILDLNRALTKAKEMRKRFGIFDDEY